MCEVQSKCFISPVGGRDGYYLSIDVVAERGLPRSHS